jgi:tripartite-type tricarboxylate transporter receptor subunit TctC
MRGALPRRARASEGPVRYFLGEAAGGAETLPVAGDGKGTLPWASPGRAGAVDRRAPRLSFFQRQDGDRALPEIAMHRLRRRAFLAIAGASLATPALAYPERPLRMVLGGPPGGLNDIVARALAQPLGTLFGQSVVVENRPGAGASIGATFAARAAPDGYTLWLGIVDTQAILPTSMRNLAYDPDRDFAPITFVCNAPFAIAVGPSKPGIDSFEALMAAAAAKPEAISFASWGVASTPHLAMQRIVLPRRIDMLHVPFSGAAPALQAVVAGQVDCTALPVGGIAQMARAGKVRALAVLARQRVPLLPDVPTLLELGGELDSGIWLALYAPAGTPQPIIERLNTAAHEAMRSPEFIEVLRQQGAVPEPSTPEELGALGRRERESWAKVVRATGAFLE